MLLRLGVFPMSLIIHLQQINILGMREKREGFPHGGVLEHKIDANTLYLDILSILGQEPHTRNLSHLFWNLEEEKNNLPPITTDWLFRWILGIYCIYL